MIRIGEVLARERRARNLTQQDVAAFVNVTKATVSKWENGTSYPDITLLPLLASFFNLTIDELLDAKKTMTKEGIRDLYQSFSDRFSQEAFEHVYEEVQQYQKLYYDDENFLLQMSVLLLNHVQLARNSDDVLQSIIDTLERIEELTEDVWIQRQVNAMIAICALMRQEAQGALDRLEGSIQPHLGEETILSQAYESLKKKDKAQEVLQVMIYQHIVTLLGGATNYLRLTAEQDDLFDETLRRFEGIITLFDLERLHPVSLQFYFAAAQYSAVRGETSRCQNYLTKYIEGALTHFLPFQLKGDPYFHLIDDWFDTLDLGAKPLRDEKFFIETLVQSIAHPAFDIYRDQAWLLALQEKIQSSYEKRKTDG